MTATGPGLKRLPGEHGLYRCPACHDSGRWWWAHTHIHRRTVRALAIAVIAASAALGLAVVMAAGGAR